MIRNGSPEFAVECKSGERGVSRSIRYFQERTDIPKFYQVHLGKKDFGIAEKTGRVLPFHIFSKELELP